MENKLYKALITKVNKLKFDNNINVSDEDSLYSEACAIFQTIVKEVETEITIDKEDYWDGEEWYDTFHDEIVSEICIKLMHKFSHMN